MGAQSHEYGVVVWGYKKAHAWNYFIYLPLRKEEDALLLFGKLSAGEAFFLRESLYF